MPRIALLLALGCLAFSASGARNLRAVEPGPTATAEVDGSGSQGSSGLVISAADDLTGYAITTGFSAAAGEDAATNAFSSADNGKPLGSGAQFGSSKFGSDTAGGNGISISASGSAVTPVSALSGGLTASQTTEGFASGFSEAFADSDDKTAQGTLSAGAGGYGARVSTGGLSLVQLGGTSSEGGVSASTTTAKSFASVLAGAGLPVLTGAYGLQSVAITDATATALANAGESFGSAYAQGNKALVVINADQKSQVVGEEGN